MAQEMKFTLSVIKADVGRVAGHNRPHPDLLKQAEECLAAGGEGRALPYLAALDRKKR
jgi:fructose 1,6-bisphosphatase